MRGFLMTVILALILTTSASAATDIILEARGYGSVVDIKDLPDPFILDVIVNADQRLYGCVVRLDGVGDYLPMRVAGYGAFANNYADVNQIPPPMPPSNSAGWNVSMSNATGWDPFGGPVSGFDGTRISTSYGPKFRELANIGSTETAGWVNSGVSLIAWLEITNFEVGQIWVRPESQLGGEINQIIDINSLGVLTITPEPASALFLLAGVVLFRRRR